MPSVARDVTMLQFAVLSHVYRFAVLAPAGAKPRSIANIFAPALRPSMTCYTHRNRGPDHRPEEHGSVAASRRHTRSWRAKKLKPGNSGPDAPIGVERRPNSDDGGSTSQGGPKRVSGQDHQFDRRNGFHTGIATSEIETASFSGEQGSGGQPRGSVSVRGASQYGDPIYGALDLGTNNCRLLLARPSRRGFRVVDAFSRIIRLGEGVSQTGRLSDHAMNRTMDALRVCAGKLQRHHVTRARMVATQACRVAANGQAFVTKVRDDFGLDIEVLTPEIEARLAVAGCATLVDPEAEFVLVFDIGGGSSEIIWLDMTRLGSRRDLLTGRTDVNDAIVAWELLPVGVVTLAERFDGHAVTPESFAAMSDAVARLLAPFEAVHRFRERLAGTAGPFPRYVGHRDDGCRRLARSRTLRSKARRWNLAELG